MKKITLCLAAAAALLMTSCGSDEDLNTANQRADSLQTVVDQKDEEIASLFEVLSDIETNLTEISSRYSKVNTLRQQNPERNQKVKGEITDELAVIDNMMAQNKQKIAQLNSKIKSLGAENEKLQNFIETLNARMTEQENQINSLMNELTISKATISKLSANVSDLTRSNKEKDEEIARQNDEMAYLADNSHRAYYVVGTYNDLKEKGIVSKEGGLLFKSQKATNSVNLSKFNLIDRNKVTTIEVNLRKAKLISDHPKGSYEFVMDDTDKKVVKQLVIKDVASFWSKTDFLIISTK